MAGQLASCSQPAVARHHSAGCSLTCSRPLHAAPVPRRRFRARVLAAAAAAAPGQPELPATGSVPSQAPPAPTAAAEAAEDRSTSNGHHHLPNSLFVAFPKLPPEGSTLTAEVCWCGGGQHAPGMPCGGSLLTRGAPGQAACKGGLPACSLALPPDSASQPGRASSVASWQLAAVLRQLAGTPTANPACATTSPPACLQEERCDPYSELCRTPIHVWESRCNACSGTGAQRSSGSSSGSRSRSRGGHGGGRHTRLGVCLLCSGLGYVRHTSHRTESVPYVNGTGPHTTIGRQPPPEQKPRRFQFPGGGGGGDKK
jgi:hypothetical protein